MTVVYDLLGFQSREHGERGIARYVLQLALALERARPGLVTQYLMHPALPFPAGAEPLVATGRVVRADRDQGLRSPSARGVFLAGSPFEDFHHPSDVVFPPWTRSSRWRTVAVLYDLIPGRFPELYLKTPLDRHCYQARLSALGGLDRLLAISETSARDAMSMLDVDRNRITVIGAGADHRFRPSVLEPAQVALALAADGAVPGLRPGYVLFPTGLDPRKNVEATIEAYGQLPPALRADHQLVVTCRLGEHGRAYLMELAVRAGAADDVLATGYVSDELLCRLYQGAHLVILPSLYEGFGLPALEAMACRAPVIVADSSSLQEVQTAAEARFDPSSAGSISAAIRRALDDDDLLARLRSQPLPPFTWDRSAGLTAGVIDDLLARDQARAATLPAQRPRLALVGALPPAGDEVASYTYRLVDELRYHCDVTVFVGGRTDSVERPDGVGVEAIDRLDLITRAGGAFDRVLYVLGSGASSVPALLALRSRPGWVLIHDIGLAELYRHLHQAGQGDPVGATVAALYPHRYRPEIEQLKVVPPEIAQRFGILLTREIAGLAENVLVHSGYEAALFELDSGLRPVAAFGRPCPEIPAGEWSRDRRPGDERPVLMSFGPLPPPDRLETLLDALREVRQLVPGTRLRLVGHGADRPASELGELARRAGVADAVELIEPLDETGRLAAVNEATVAVQLQPPGAAASAAVAQLLAAGAPTVVAEAGSMSDLPEEAVVKIEADAPAGRLSEVLIGLLTDEDARETRSLAARDHAKASSFASAAEALAQVLFT